MRVSVSHAHIHRLIMINDSRSFHRSIIPQHMHGDSATECITYNPSGVSKVGSDNKVL